MSGAPRRLGKRVVALGSLAACVLGVALVAARVTRAEAGLGRGGGVRISRVQAIYEPGTGKLSLRLQPTSGAVVFYETADKAQVESLLRIVQTFASGGVGLHVAMEADQVTALQLDAGARP